MLSIGDIHIIVRDIDAAVAFWADGLGLEVTEQEAGEDGNFARLDFPEGGPALILVSPDEAWDPAEDDEFDEHFRPAVSFDVVTTTFDATLARLLDRGGRQIGEIEAYNDLRLVTVADPENNQFELIEMPPEAGD